MPLLEYVKDFQQKIDLLSLMFLLPPVLFRELRRDSGRQWQPRCPHSVKPESRH